MKIESARLSNFAGYSKVEVNFDKNVTYLIGKNGAGKSTIGITAIWVALQGIAEKSKTALIGERFRFIGNGAVSSSVGLTLFDEKANARIEVERRITKSGNELSFKAPDGYRVDKDWLDNLFNVFLLAPKKFTELSSKQQAEALGIDTTAFDESIKALKSEYTLINRDLTNMGQLLPVERTERVEVSELNKEKNNVIEFNKAQDERQKKIDEANTAVTNLVTSSEDISNQIAELQNKIAELSTKKTELLTRIAKGREYVKTLPQPEEKKPTDIIDEKINKATETNEKAFKYEKYQADLLKKQGIEAKLQRNKEAQAKKQEEWTNFIKGQKLPFHNLTINEDGELLLDNKPIKEPYFSTGELLKKVPVLMASRNPELKYVFLQDFNLLDEDMQKEVEEALTSQGMQLVIELVGKEKIDGKNCILLKDCQVVDSYNEENKNEL